MATVTLRCFAAAREAAGAGSTTFDADRLDELLAAASDRFGAQWSAVLATARVWVNGDEPASGDATALHDGDEVAVLPPVSGGCTPLGDLGADPAFLPRPADEVGHMLRPSR